MAAIHTTNSAATSMQEHSPFGAGLDASPTSNGHHNQPKQAQNKTVPSAGSKSTGGKSAGGEQSSEDSEGDSADEADADADTPERHALSRGYGMGKGKRPSIRVDQTNASEADDRNAGPTSERMSALHLDTPSKKRSYSNASIHSVLNSGAESDEMQGLTEDYPRKKQSRQLSNTNSNRGLLTYEGLRKPSIDSEVDPKDSTEMALDDSDDEEAYKAVDLIPDDEDENEGDLDTVERKFLKEAYAQASDNDSDDEGPDVSLLLDGAGFFDEFMPVGGDLPPTSPMPQFALSDDVSMPPSTSTRRVRFDDEVKEMSDASSDTSSEDLNSFFPDLFHKEAQLVPGFNPSHFEVDDGGLYEGSTASDSEISYWDVQERGTEWHDVHTESESESESSEAGSSGYETDEGDTTDEELPPPPTIHMPSRVHRDSTSSESTSTATPKPFPRSRPKSRSSSKASGKSTAKPKGPRKGYFTLDPRRAVAVLDVTGKKMCLIPARIPDNAAWPASTASSTANNSPRSSYQALEGGDSDFSEGTGQKKYADVMLSGMFGVAGGLNYPVGPPEAFYPYLDFDANGNMVQEDEFDDDDDVDGEGDKYEAMLDIGDIFDFGNDSENSGDDDADYPPVATSPSAADPSSTPAKPHHETGDKLLEHFDRPGVLTSFRRNQTRYRDLASLPDDPELRASTSRPVRTGGSADTIITPLRKRKSSSAAARGSPLSQRAPVRRPGPVAGGFSARRN